MNEPKKMSLKRYAVYLLLTAAAVLAVLNFDKVAAAVKELGSILSPLIIGCIFAYIFNIIMRRLEKVYFPKSTSKPASATRRPVCLVLSMLLVIIILGLVIRLIVPEIANIFTVLGDTIPVYLEKMREFLMKYEDDFPVVGDYIKDTLQNGNINWQSTITSIIDFATNGVGGFISSTVSVISTVAGGVVNAVIGLIFAVYILYNKEKLHRQINKLLDCYLKPLHANRIRYICATADKCFSSFIVGQCTEAVILGLLCALGMTILRLPYASTIGTLIGSTALIPIVGAYLGAILGALMILVVDPIKALWFLIFLVILQQVEGNVIYPKVVGSSIGLPGMWVLAAVTVGGGLGGIGGMLLGVPAAATVYKLLENDVRKKSAVSPAAADVHESTPVMAEKEPPQPQISEKTDDHADKTAAQQVNSGQTRSNKQSPSQAKSRKGGKGRKR